MKKTRDTLPPPGGRRAKPKHPSAPRGAARQTEKGDEKVSPLQYHYGFPKP